VNEWFGKPESRKNRAALVMRAAFTLFETALPHAIRLLASFVLCGLTVSPIFFVIVPLMNPRVLWFCRCWPWRSQPSWRLLCGATVQERVPSWCPSVCLKVSPSRSWWQFGLLFPIARSSSREIRPTTETRQKPSRPTATTWNPCPASINLRVMRQNVAQPVAQLSMCRRSRLDAFCLCRLRVIC